MQDINLDNRKSALNSFNAAIRTKPDLVLPYLGQLLPLVIAQTFVDPKLIREVSMGPFKIKVDDGLEMRKVSSSAAVFAGIIAANHSNRVLTRLSMRSWTHAHPALTL